MKIFIGIAIVVLIFVLANSVYTVNEAEQVVITQFGRPVGESVITPGLKFKTPFIQVVNRFDKRILEWDGDPDKVTTQDKRFIWVDVYARWKITNPKLFMERLTDERTAQSRLDDILDGTAREVIAQHKLVEVVRSTNREPEVDDNLEEDIEVEFEPIKIGRKKIEQIIFNAAKPQISNMGIELMDFRFKRINYTEDVQREIDDRMISERKRIAEKYRSEGNGEMMRIMGQKERELKRIMSGATKESQIIIGEGDAQAVSIYAAAYNKSAESREFFEFMKTLDTYKTTFSSKDTLIMTTDNSYFKYLNK
ncbi:MAG: protease modulator HflC [Kiritimatiellae bacterium]|jgi:membrane protease subunit HflC|nr:protease modulator HflC [Kiritimatiellia bacterium]